MVSSTVCLIFPTFIYLTGLWRQIELSIDSHRHFPRADQEKRKEMQTEVRVLKPVPGTVHKYDTSRAASESKCAMIVPTRCSLQRAIFSRIPCSVDPTYESKKTSNHGKHTRSAPGNDMSVSCSSLILPTFMAYILLIQVTHHTTTLKSQKE
jgi:hypothetical protein